MLNVPHTGSQTEENRHIVYFDLIRIIAVFLVVMVHVSAMGMDTLLLRTGDEWNFEYFWAVFWNGLAFCGVSLFVMLSGALELEPLRSADLKRVLFKAGRLFLIYYFWKAVYQIVDMLENGAPFTGENIKNDLILALIQERGYYHIWFFLMLAVLFLFVPMIKPAVQDRKICRYFLIMFFCIAVFYPTLILYEFKFKYLLMDFMERSNMFLFTGYLGYFVLGHYLNTHIKQISVRAKGLLSAAALVSMLLSGYLAVGEIRINNPFTPMVFLASSVIFLACKSADGRLSVRPGPVKWLHFGAELAMGICLLHPLTIILLINWNITPDLMPRVISIPLLTLLVVAITGIATAVGRKVPGLRLMM